MASFNIYEEMQKGTDKPVGGGYGSLGKGRVGVEVAGEMGGMFGGAAMQGMGFQTPAQQRQANIMKVREQFPNPTTDADFRQLGNALHSIGETDMAEKAFDQITSSTSSKDFAFDAKIERINQLNISQKEKDKMIARVLSGAGSSSAAAQKHGYKSVIVNGEEQWIPIPGGPADTEQKEIIRAEKEKNKSVIRSSKLVTNTIGKLKKLIKSASNDNLNPIFGVPGAGASYIPGSNRKDAENLATTIKSHIGFDRLDRMRKESPTGGALGQVSEMELKQLNATLGSLDFAQSEAQFLEILDQISAEYDYIMQKIQETGDGTFTEPTPDKDPFNIGL